MYLKCSLTASDEFNKKLFWDPSFFVCIKINHHGIWSINVPHHVEHAHILSIHWGLHAKNKANVYLHWHPYSIHIFHFCPSSNLFLKSEKNTFSTSKLKSNIPHSKLCQQLFRFKIYDCDDFYYVFLSTSNMKVPLLNAKCQFHQYPVMCWFKLCNFQYL